MGLVSGLGGAGETGHDPGECGGEGGGYAFGAGAPGGSVQFEMIDSHGGSFS
jgi:hypothetical protein